MHALLRSSLCTEEKSISNKFCIENWNTCCIQYISPLVYDFVISKERGHLVHVYKYAHAVAQCDSCNVCTHAPSREGEESLNTMYTASRKLCFILLRQCCVKICRRSLTYLKLNIEKQNIFTLHLA